MFNAIMQMILTNSVDPKATLKGVVSSRHTPFATINILLVINGQNKTIYDSGHISRCINWCLTLIDGPGGYDVNINP